MNPVNGQQTKSNNNTHIIQMSQHEMLTQIERKKNDEKEEEEIEKSNWPNFSLRCGF